MEHVFIVGIARSGSKIYLQLLNRYSNINMTSELNFLWPAWIRKDFRSVVDRKIGNLQDDKNVNCLIDHMYTGSFSGTFWQTEYVGQNTIRGNKIDGLDRKLLKKRLLNSDRSYRNIFKTIIDEHARAMGKRVAGAKFPVDISYVPTIMRWFPDAKFILTIRDPRAVYSSMLRMDIRKKRNAGLATKKYLALRRLVYLTLQYKKVVDLYQKNKDAGGWFLMRFEDAVSDPENRMKAFCDFLAIPFSEDFLRPPIDFSSYGSSEQKQGFDKKTLERWKQYVTRWEDCWIKLALKNPMAIMGY